MLKPQTGNYKKAFNCKKCPQRGDEDGCPMWWEIPVEREDNPLERDIMKGCGYALMPKVLNSVVKASWTGTAEVNAMREEVVETVHVATQQFLHLQGRQEKLLSGGEVEGHNQPRDGLVLEGRHEGDEDSDSVDLGDYR